MSSIAEATRVTPLQTQVEVKGSVTVLPPLLLPDGVRDIAFRVKLPTTDDDGGRFAEKGIPAKFQLWCDGKRSWAFETTGGIQVVNDRPWEPRVYRKGERVNDLTTIYRAFEDTDKPYTDKKYWEAIGNWFPIEQSHTFLQTQVRADGQEWVVTAEYGGEYPQLIEPDIILYPGTRSVIEEHHSVAVVDTDYAIGSASSLTSATITVGSGDNIVAIGVGVGAVVGQTLSSAKWGGSGGTDMLSPTNADNTAASTNRVYSRYHPAPASDSTVYCSFGSAAGIKSVEIVSAEDADTTTPQVSGSGWNTDTYGATSSISSGTVTTVADGLAVGIAAAYDEGAYGGMTAAAGGGQTATHNYNGTEQGFVGWYKNTSGSSDSFSATLTQAYDYDTRRAAAGWCIAPAGGGGPTYSPQISSYHHLAGGMR